MTRPADCRTAQPRCARACRYALPSGCCALALAELGEHTLQEIGDHFGFTRENARLIEVAALGKLRHRLELAGLDLRFARRDVGEL